MCKYACTKACSYCAKNKGDSRDLSSRTEENFFKLGFTPCKAEQPLRGMELQENKGQKD